MLEQNVAKLFQYLPPYWRLVLCMCIGTTGFACLNATFASLQNPSFLTLVLFFIACILIPLSYSAYAIMNKNTPSPTLFDKPQHKEDT